eukprot:jgi/Mesvir1/27793/Mv07474-RA.1
MSPSSSHDGVLVPLQEAEPHGLPSLACFSQEHLPLSHLPQEPHGGVTLQGMQASAALPYASREELAAFHDPQPHDELTLQDVVAVRGVGALLVSFLPLVQRVRLRSLCRSLCAAVDESLESLRSFAGDDLAGASGDGTRALAWLTAKCRNLVALGPLKGYRRDKGGAAWVKTFDVLDPSRMTTSVASSAPALTAGNGSLSAGGDAVGDGRGGDEEGSVRRRDDGSDDGKYYVQYVAAHRLSIKSIALGCMSLIHLDVTGCRSIGDTGIAAIGEHCPLLEHLSAGYCPKVTDGSISVVAERCARLRHLDVGGCSGVTDAGIGLVLERCAELEGLVVHKCMRVTDRSITAIGRASSSTMNTSTLALPALPAAYLPLNADPDGPAMFGSGSSHGRSDHGSRVRANASDGPRKLRQLDLGGCHQVTDASVSAVAMQELPSPPGAPAGIGVVVGNCRRLRSVSADGSGVTRVLFPSNT